MRSKRRHTSNDSETDDDRSVRPGTVTSIETQRLGNRFNIFIDGEFGFGVSRDTLLESGLARGTTLDQETIDGILARDEIDRAISAAMRLLEERMRSSDEVRTRLRRKGFGAIAVEATIERLTDLNLLDDERFAERWIENRQEHRPRSRRMLEYELRRKGVDRQVIAETVASMSIDEAEAARAVAVKAHARLTRLPPADQKRKLVGILARRGFDHATIRSAVAEVLSAEGDASETGDSDLDMV